MNVIEEQKDINTALDYYRQQLDEIPDEQFDVTPSIGGWSYAEMYSHILQANLGSSIAAEKCCRKTGVSTNKGLNLWGWYTFLTNSFPPVKTRPPAQMDAVTKKITKEDARNLIIRLRKRLDELVPLLAKSDGEWKVAHPALGMLTGPQWIKFIRIHTQHHIKQLNRIKKSFPQR